MARDEQMSEKRIYIAGMIAILIPTLSLAAMWGQTQNEIANIKVTQASFVTEDKLGITRTRLEYLTKKIENISKKQDMILEILYREQY